MNELSTEKTNNGITITKEEIAQLETTAFTGHIVVVDNEADAQKATEYLSRYTILGFDTETRPSFKKGQSHKVALVQISTADTCVLFRIKQMGMVAPLKALIENENIQKIGLSLHDDFAMLRKMSNFEPKGFVELQHFVKQYNIQDMSLQKIYAILFGGKISKGQRLSNWEAETLTDAQKRYAATDAWACVQIYTALQNQEFVYYKQS